MHVRFPTGWKLLSLIVLLGTGPAPVAAQETQGAEEAQVIHACYVPASGTVYRIRTADMREACSSSTHVEFSWTDGEGALRAGDEVGGDLEGALTNPRVVALLGRALGSTPPADGQVLSWDEAGGQWVPTTTVGGVTEHAGLTGLDADDHPQYLRSDGTRPLAGDLNAANHRIRAVAPAASPGEVLVFGQAAGGDLEGTMPGPEVAALRGRPVEDVVPMTGQVLAWDGTHWTPASPAPAGTITSPNGQYSLSVTDAGIIFQGPAGVIRMDGDGIEVVSTGMGEVLVQADRGLMLRSTSASVQLQSPFQIGLTGGTVLLNGSCSGIARIGDTVTVAGAQGTITNGSPTVLGC